MQLKAVIFDCDGVIADDERVHLTAFRRVLAPAGISVSDADYFSRYLGFNDIEAIAQALVDHDRVPAKAEVENLAEVKKQVFRELISEQLVIYPGVVEFVRKLSVYPLAIASGALREEIELILSSAGIEDCFEAIVSAQDVSRGKPDPEPFLAALGLLRQKRPVSAGECLVVEDSLAGVEAAKSAGMRCLAVTNSYQKAALTRADMVVESLEGLSVAQLREIF